MASSLFTSHKYGVTTFLLLKDFSTHVAGKASSMVCLRGKPSAGRFYWDSDKLATMFSVKQRPFTFSTAGICGQRVRNRNATDRSFRLRSGCNIRSLGEAAARLLRGRANRRRGGRATRLDRHSIREVRKIRSSRFIAPT